jgi:hypothetical protein
MPDVGTELVAVVCLKCRERGQYSAILVRRGVPIPSKEEERRQRTFGGSNEGEPTALSFTEID